MFSFITLSGNLHRTYVEQSRRDNVGRHRARAVNVVMAILLYSRASVHVVVLPSCRTFAVVKNSRRMLQRLGQAKQQPMRRMKVYERV
ncbi:MAG: hypothetical protein GY880_29345 [Planctomycetaceae bacterium]|nr:hypothetical protein [Planctomycetaceae bacterium]